MTWFLVLLLLVLCAPWVAIVVDEIYESLSGYTGNH